MKALLRSFYVGIVLSPRTYYLIQSSQQPYEEDTFLKFEVVAGKAAGTQTVIVP